MSNWLLELLLLFYVLYGLRLLCRHGRGGKGKLYLLVKDQEEVLEGILRYTMTLLKRKGLGMQVIVVDGGSQDLTPAICGRLAQYYSFHYIFLEEQELREFLSQKNEDLILDLRQEREFRQACRSIKGAISNDRVTIKIGESSRKKGSSL